MESENYLFIEVKVEDGEPKVNIKAKGIFEKYVSLVKKLIDMIFSFSKLIEALEKHADELKDMFKETFGEELEDSDGSREEQS